MPAEQPAVPPPAPPPPIPHGPPIALELAKRVAAAAEAEARKNGWPMAIAITEPTGALVHFLKMDDVQYASIELAMVKAKTAAIYRRPTKMFTEALGNGHLMFLTFPDLCAAPGGLPLGRRRQADRRDRRQRRRRPPGRYRRASRRGGAASTFRQSMLILAALATADHRRRSCGDERREIRRRARAGLRRPAA